MRGFGDCRLFGEAQQGCREDVLKGCGAGLCWPSGVNPKKNPFLVSIHARLTAHYLRVRPHRGGRGRWEYPETENWSHAIGQVASRRGTCGEPLAKNRCCTDSRIRPTRTTPCQQTRAPTMIPSTPDTLLPRLWGGDVGLGLASLELQILMWGERCCRQVAECCPQPLLSIMHRLLLALNLLFPLILPQPPPPALVLLPLPSTPSC